MLAAAMLLNTASALSILVMPQVAEDIAGDVEKLRTSIGHFDFAVFLMCVAELGQITAQVIMTDSIGVIGREGFSQFLRQIFVPGEARDAVFPLDDAELAFTLRAFERALMERGYSAFGWYGETDSFIEENLQNSSEQ